MRITWYGHACFRLQGQGVSLILDPYSPEGSGLGAVTDTADYVLMSSSLDEAHSNWGMIPGSPRVINTLEAVREPIRLVDGLDVSAVAASEGNDRPDNPKANAMYWFRLEGIRFCHMGDIGTALTEDQVQPLRGKVDVLFALAGAGLTIALADLNLAIEAIGPRLVIPMHYWTPRNLYGVGKVDAFLAGRPEDPTVIWESSSFDLSTESLPERRTVLVLKAQHG